MKKTTAVLFLLGGMVLCVIAVIGCQTNQPNPEPGKISIEGLAFNPAVDTITKGTTVTWTNKDPYIHTVTSGVPGTPDGLFDSGDLSQNQTYSRTFDSTGTFKYYCKHHPSMTGEIIAQ
jgi:plastocyanin